MRRRLRLATLTVAGIGIVALIAAPGAFAVAPMAEDVSASSPDGAPVAVTLHGSDDFDAMLTFSVVSGPSSGSLGAIGPLDCSFPGGQVDCTAEVEYTPGLCANGQDSFAYRVDDGIAFDDGTATISVSSLVPQIPAPQFVSMGAAFEGMASSVTEGASVDYGDATGNHVLLVGQDGKATLSHVYSNEGSYPVTVRNPNGCEAQTFAHVLIPGATESSLLSVAPGETGTLDLGSLTATLTTSSLDPSDVTLMAALYPPGTPGFDPRALTTLAAFDLRAIAATQNDVLVAKFRYPADTPPGGRPTLLFVNPATGEFEPVRGSTKVPDSLLFDPGNREITVVFDETSFPRLQDLTGTQFVVAHDRRPHVRIRGVLARCAFGVRVKDDGKLRRVTAKLDGVPVQTSKRKRFRLRFPVAALDEGRHRLRVVAVARGGGRGADVKRFHRFGGRCFSS